MADRPISGKLARNQPLDRPVVAVPGCERRQGHANPLLSLTRRLHPALSPAIGDRWMKLLRFAYRSFIGAGLKEGRLEIRFPDGVVEGLGSGQHPTVRIAISDMYWCIRLLLDPEFAVGEAYTEGVLVIEVGDLRDFAELLSRNGRYRSRRAGWLLRLWDDCFHQLSARKISQANAAHHYGLKVSFFQTFLDEDMQYSCAYFSRPDVSLEEAQHAKKQLIARKLLLEPGQRVLDMGCGWGGLAIELARSGVEVEAVTLSIEQRIHAASRVGREGLGRRVRVNICDYRDIEGLYDRIVSVGMFEHVGRPHFREFFRQIERHLCDGGVALIHTIGRTDGPGVSQKWIQRRIFPGGYIPALSEIVAAIELSGLTITDVEVLRLHYAETLRHWLMRFRANQIVLARIYGERFYRMWEFYLSVSEAAFRYDGLCVFQVQVAKRIDAVPTTRDYLVHEPVGQPMNGGNAQPTDKNGMANPLRHVE